MSSYFLAIRNEDRYDNDYSYEIGLNIANEFIKNKRTLNFQMDVAYGMLKELVQVMNVSSLVSDKFCFDNIFWVLQATQLMISSIEGSSLKLKFIEEAQDFLKKLTLEKESKPHYGLIIQKLIQIFGY